jgi:hypothetical protein
MFLGIKVLLTTEHGPRSKTMDYVGKKSGPGNKTMKKKPVKLNSGSGPSGTIPLPQGRPVRKGIIGPMGPTRPAKTKPYEDKIMKIAKEKKMQNLFNAIRKIKPTGRISEKDITDFKAQNKKYGGGMKKKK